MAETRDLSLVPDDGWYSDLIRAAIRKRLFQRWPPRSNAERECLEHNARFFDGCTYEEADAEGRTVDEIADDEIDAVADLAG